MKIYSKNWVEEMPISLKEAWDFFSRPENLDLLTPDEMRFEITSKVKGVEMYEGMLIEYKVAPILNINMHWMTEITHIKEGEYFIDEQRFGPYTLWHHEHHFEATDNGVKMIDKLYYAIPFGPIGRIANWIFVNNKIEEIFHYRKQKIAELFNQKVVLK